MKTKLEEIFVDAVRDNDTYSMFCLLMDKLGWAHYPTYVDGEDIDNGNDSDEAENETIEVPMEDVELFEFLDEQGVFDNL